MSDTITTQSTEPATPTRSSPFSVLFAGRRGRKLRESLLAYLLLAPAFIIIFTFGIFPLAFSAYESTLRGLNKIVGTYDGIGNYTRAIGDLAYVLGFWLAVVFIYMAINGLVKKQRLAREYEDRPWLLAPAAAVLAIGFGLFARFFFLFLPETLRIADKMRDAQRAGETDTAMLFRRFLGEAFQLPAVQQAFWISILVIIVGAVISYLAFRSTPPSLRNSAYYAGYFNATVLLLGAGALAWFTWMEVRGAYAAALEEGADLTLWSQIITISAGLVLLGLSWWIWRSADQRDSNMSMFLRLVAGAALIVGAWVLIGELPRAAAAGDDDWWQGLLHTVWYSIGSIPFEFGISLMLATFLFQNIKGKAFFRMVYFLPYITPTVGAAAIFRILFSNRIDSFVNQIVTGLGFNALSWLDEPAGIFQMIIGDSVVLPAWAAGPSLSMVVIIIFSVWAFVGFYTVLFLAGLGGIPNSLYEAASIDGAGRWAQFRHVTLPLLSPTIYFATLYAVIGTFKAFNHIFVLRTPAALGTADTASLVIFDAMKRDTRYGYAAALAVLLLIIVMILTVINNRLASKRVFYG